MASQVSLFDPTKLDTSTLDDESARQLRSLIDWFEDRGKARLLSDDLDAVWTADFLAFVAKEKLFATFCTPAAYADGDPNKRWDASRNAVLSEILGFYGLSYWYAWQVTVLGLGPVWMSDNDAAKRRAAALLDEGGVAAFGLSERAHGADVYSTDMLLAPGGGDGVEFTASGEKYYIGNGNVAGTVSVFGRRTDVEGPEAYVFFVADSGHDGYVLRDNVVHGQMFVSTFALENYPVRAEDILHTGADAFSAALNTVNVGKFNLCTGSIGICEHAFHEAITHAHNRILYGNRVTEFPHVRASFVDAYARLIAMKLFSARALDYFRSASAEDRRYLLFNPMTMAKVTSEGETVVRTLHDVIAAKGYEKNTYFREAAQLIGTLPKLEGTVHVNVALMLKFMPAYMFAPTEFPAVEVRDDASDDAFFFAQGPARGASKVRFQDWVPVYEKYSAVPNVGRFYEQVLAFRQFLTESAPNEEQQRDLDFLLNVGHLFSLVVYGHLILESADAVSTEVLDQIFDFQVRDFSAYAVALYSKPSSTEAQQAWAVGALRKPVVNAARFDAVWGEVLAYDGVYEMRP
ncbi:acyl-CoA dehydrogenase [Rhodococcus sp. 06-156-3C]|uniref:acyl-CoA dehydrogenase family protein n=1 Tax=Nocardiaceae TaxID=85025 RepID=UPI0005230510|nr:MULTISPECIES: acyl-CoA dehydrogenase family protein [Rhodococcus]OZD05744.1 acyl-CoA dehydrogenase [Rhodococcus sp. 06-156-4C]OZD16858.1 acyl-CoA dehydrogenase [Rhodococcus sp. 06-156-4a]OZD26716.1 acyl-CoA dehydrogenase [Rhodococcus sp. 06-156-3C]OZD32113.1 acyl-CoA dehydrogenase [Rhodococcus sp. 06-156-3b]OZD35411.1 acyl-CoA dehydrogenase [Rhodococcus sp. 06-156-3]